MLRVIWNSLHVHFCASAMFCKDTHFVQGMTKEPERGTKCNIRPPSNYKFQTAFQMPKLESELLSLLTDLSLNFCGIKFLRLPKSYTSRTGDHVMSPFEKKNCSVLSPTMCYHLHCNIIGSVLYHR